MTSTKRPACSVLSANDQNSKGPIKASRPAAKRRAGPACWRQAKQRMKDGSQDLIHSYSTWKQPVPGVGKKNICLPANGLKWPERLSCKCVIIIAEYWHAACVPAHPANWETTVFFKSFHWSISGSSWTSWYINSVLVARGKSQSLCFSRRNLPHSALSGG